MKTFYLVRHAQYANPLNILVGRLPVELSEAGKKEAGKLASFFENKNIDKIYSSPVLRCKQTSEIISSNSISIEHDLRIAETLSAFQGYWEMDWDYFFTHAEDLGGETPQDIHNRVTNFWDEVQSKNHNNVVICSHGDPLYLLYANIAGIPLPTIREIYKIPEDEYQPKASIRTLIVDNNETSIGPIINL
ncbi:histidine phosphatase family protein [Patescibacteria group bacterium]|nr:histidine phosphatase family protein [Patescibacteria group bacterium]